MNQYYILIGIIYMIPFLIMIGISISRKRLETDRNFYGNEIQPENIELTNVKYNSFEVQRDEIKKIAEMGKIKYVFHEPTGKTVGLIFKINLIGTTCKTDRISLALSE